MDDDNVTVSPMQIVLLPPTKTETLSPCVMLMLIGSDNMVVPLEPLAVAVNVCCPCGSVEMEKTPFAEVAANTPFANSL